MNGLKPKEKRNKKDTVNRWWKWRREGEREYISSFLSSSSSFAILSLSLSLSILFLFFTIPSSISFLSFMYIQYFFRLWRWEREVHLHREENRKKKYKERVLMEELKRERETWQGFIQHIFSPLCSISVSFSFLESTSSPSTNSLPQFRHILFHSSSLSLSSRYLVSSSSSFFYRPMGVDGKTKERRCNMRE